MILVIMKIVTVTMMIIKIIMVTTTTTIVALTRRRRKKKKNNKNKKKNNNDNDDNNDDDDDVSVCMCVQVNTIILIYAMTMVCRHSEYVFGGKEKTTASGIRYFVFLRVLFFWGEGVFFTFSAVFFCLCDWGGGGGVLAAYVYVYAVNA